MKACGDKFAFSSSRVGAARRSLARAADVATRTQCGALNPGSVSVTL